jgi:hypothetical protein
MGKKAKLKAMRKIAREMPAMQYNVPVGVKALGKELIARGITEVEGKPVLPNGKYKGMQTLPQPLNHYRQMKKLYNTHGKGGVGSYINAVAQKQATNG